MRERKELFNNCLKFSQILLLAILSITAFSSWARDLSADQLNPYYIGDSRAPSSYVANVELEDQPIENIIWLERTFAEDDAGVLVEMRDNLASWAATDEYAKVWNLKSTGLYNTPDMQERKKFINQRILRYIDKRISGEIRHAKKGSGWAKVGSVQKALKPNTTVKVSKYFKLKIRARVIEGKIIFDLRNPFFKLESYVKLNGSVATHAEKEFKSTGIKTTLDYQMNEGTMAANAVKEFKSIGLTTALNYEVKQGRWIASIDKKITKEVGARLSAERTGFISLYDDKAIQVLQFYFNHAF